MGRLQDNYTRYPRAILWLVRGGTTTVGGEEPDAGPCFETAVGSFYLSKLPVTNLQFEAFDSGFERSGESPGDDDPATGVDYAQARGYCAWYARVSRKAMRLPTELEWEYACRAGTPSRSFVDGMDDVDAYVLHAGNSSERVPALSRTRPNPFGLHAMLGGVWEWTSSLYMPYPVVAGDGRDDPNATGSRVLRGGSWRTPLSEIGSPVRRAAAPTTREPDVGFRVARSLHDG